MFVPPLLTKLSFFLVFLTFDPFVPRQFYLCPCVGGIYACVFDVISVPLSSCRSQGF